MSRFRVNFKKNAFEGLIRKKGHGYSNNKLEYYTKVLVKVV